MKFNTLANLHRVAVVSSILLLIIAFIIAFLLLLASFNLVSLSYRITTVVLFSLLFILLLLRLLQHKLNQHHTKQTREQFNDIFHYLAQCSEHECLVISQEIQRCQQIIQNGVDQLSTQIITVSNTPKPMQTQHEVIQALQFGDISVQSLEAVKLHLENLNAINKYFLTNDFQDLAKQSHEFQLFCDQLLKDSNHFQKNRRVNQTDLSEGDIELF
jgi:ABC-type multidrug transport system fused ATPase/permease subunit